MRSINFISAFIFCTLLGSQAFGMTFINETLTRPHYYLYVYFKVQEKAGEFTNLKQMGMVYLPANSKTTVMDVSNFLTDIKTYALQSKKPLKYYIAAVEINSMDLNKTKPIPEFCRDANGKAQKMNVKEINQKFLHVSSINFGGKQILRCKLESGS